MSYSVVHLNWTSIFECFVIRRGSKNIHHKDKLLHRYWTKCLKHVNHSKFNTLNNMTISEEGGTNSSHTPQSGQILKSPRAEVAIE